MKDIFFFYFIAIIFYFLFDDIFVLNYKKYTILDNTNFEEKETIKIIHNFILIIYSLFCILSLIKTIKNIQIIYVSIILIKYSSYFYFNENTNNFLYEFRRSLMWLFATPVMLDLYLLINKINFKSIKIQYHLIPMILNLPFLFFKNTIYYNLFFIFGCLSESYFIYNLFNLKHLKYTHLYIFFWSLFGVLQVIDFFNLFKTSTINIIYGISDLMVKLTSMIVIYDNEEQKLEISNFLDLQSITLMNNIYVTLENFKNDNIVSDNCNKIINYISDSLQDIHINEKKNLIKIELLKKILPYDLDEKYFMKNINKYTKHDNVVILFTDIVSYSDFSCKIMKKMFIIY